MSFSQIRHCNNHRKSQRGFTLVELSIVLLVISLIISSVLVGQDLIRNAELRATISQYENYNSAVAAFRGKYEGLPGDIPGNTNFGFTGNGDGNGVLVGPTVLATENVYFWSHLGATGAELISGTYSGVAATTTNLNAITPTAKSGVGNWGVYYDSTTGKNHYILGLTTPAAGSSLDVADTLTPLDAKYIDSKIDDGMPNKGTVNAGIGGATAYTAPDAACASTATSAGVYSTTTKTVANTVACTLRFRLSI